MIVEISSFKISLYLKENSSNKYIIFLHGGSKHLGKDRFKEWQDKLSEKGFGSLSFDFPGVGASDGIFSEQSLDKRIKTAKEVIKWFQENHKNAEIYLCGLSMSGYIACGLIHEMPHVFTKLILLAPAAYSQNAHDLSFDESFTQELRKPNSWIDSLSFQWLKKSSTPTMLIVAEKDMIIPKEVIGIYKKITSSKMGSKVVTLKNASHVIWSDSKDDKSFRNQALEEIISFI
jgi:pimeloyl-ACP methyl ester carboxylesterase